MSQFRLLFGNAWRRFTRLDGLARNSDPRSVLILGAIVFSMPGAFLAFFLAFPVMIGAHMAMSAPGLILNQLAYYSALLVALAALLEWDVLLPEAGDCAVLAPLPVSRRKVVAAHGAALAALLAILTVAVNAASLVLIPMLDEQHKSLIDGMARQAGGIVVTASIAFCAVLVLRALALGCASIPGLRRLGAILRLAGLLSVIAALLVLPVQTVVGAASWRSGTTSPLPLAGWAAGLAIAAVGLFVLAGNRAFRPQRHARGGRRNRALGRGLGQGAAQAAVTRFAALTLQRCGRQRMAVSAWFAVGAGVVLSSAVSLGWGAAPVLSASARGALAVPLVLGFFLLAGLRNSFAIPVEVRANWIFRLCGDAKDGVLTACGRRLMRTYLLAMLEQKQRRCSKLRAIACGFSWGQSRRRYGRGCYSRAVFALIPAAGFAFWVWPLGAALEQLAFLALAGLLWIQILTWNLHKIPFTCSYQPGGANLIYLWPMYAAGFILGGYEVAGWEQWLLQDGWRMAASLVLMSAALIWSKHRRGRSPAGGYQFEDDPEPVVQTLLTN